MTVGSSTGLVRAVSGPPVSMRKEVEKARRVARQFRSGGVYINGSSADPGTPLGGYRQSGNGREGGAWGLDEYLVVKTICGSK